MTVENQIAIIGGGPAGIFAAINAAEQAKGKQISIHLFEATDRYLTKVEISGGGRCNVTNGEENPVEFAKNYPRGNKELLSPLSQFSSLNTIDWFKKHGVTLKKEEDGRMFPSTNQSDTIVDCLLTSAEKLKIEMHTKHKVEKIDRNQSNQFDIHFDKQKAFLASKLLLATGSGEFGYKIARSFGHSIAELAPSLFSFNIRHPILKDLSGTSFPDVEIILDAEKKIVQRGALLITHWGISGPAVLKLSAFSARELKHLNYNTEIFINWMGLAKKETLSAMLKKIKEEHAKALVQNVSLNNITKNFWGNLLSFLQINPSKRWGDISKIELNQIIDNLFAMPLQILSKNRFKDEFVQCGGVELKEINFKTMESRIVPNLFFAGEILDIDGITGGFNFQNAWTTGFIAGNSLIT